METYIKAELKKILQKEFEWVKKEYNFKLYKSDNLLRVENDILQGMYFQPSEGKRAVCVTIFIQPLFIPSETKHLSYGFRMDEIRKKQEEWIELNKSGIERINSFLRDVGLDFLSLYNSPLNILNNINREEYPFLRDINIWKPSLIVYCAAYVGNNEIFNSTIKKAKKYFEDKYHEWHYEWMKNRLNELEMLENAVRKGQQKQLLSDIVTMMSNKLKINKYV